MPGLKATTEPARVYMQPEMRTQDPANVQSWARRGDTRTIALGAHFLVLKEICTVESLFLLKDAQDRWHGSLTLLYRGLQ